MDRLKKEDVELHIFS